MTTRTTRFLSGIFATAILALPWPAGAEEPFATPAIDGYSPVSYFTQGVAERGSPRFAVTHAGNTYHLTSAGQVALFEADPDRYRPRYSVCPYSLTQGGKLPLDPTNFKIVGGQLLLFHRSESVDGLALWEASGVDEAELMRRADRRYRLLTF